MRKFTSADAKNNFGELIDAARLAPVAVTKYSKPFVVVMAAEEFERIKAKKKYKYQPGAQTRAAGFFARNNRK